MRLSKKIRLDLERAGKLPASRRILFLDDRSVRHKKFLSHCVDAVCVWTADAAIDALGRGRWDIAFLDHDLNDEGVPLGPENNGCTVAKWIAANKPQVRRFIVHSTNPVGGPRMVRIIEPHYPVIHLGFEAWQWIRELSRKT